MTSRNLISVIVQVAFLCAFVFSTMFAADKQDIYYEIDKSDVAVSAGITSPAFINSIPHAISSSKPIRKYHKDPYDPPADKLARLHREQYDPNNPQYIIDQSTGSVNKSAATFEPCRSFNGIYHTGWNPPDPHMAAGPDHLVVVVNSSIAIFDKNTGQKLLQSTAGVWFENTSPPPPSYFIFDPKVVYDPNPGRFIILYLCTDDVSQSSYLVSVSQSSDAMGNWDSYNLDAAVNGDIPAATWPDYPGLGFDYDEAVYITSNQWMFGGGYQYVKVRILDKASLYSGGPITFHDIWNLKYHDFSTAFTVKPATAYSDADGEFLLSNIWYGGNYTTYWKITDPVGIPTLTTMPKVNLGSSYTSPPAPVQKGGSPTLSILGPMTQEVIYRNGMVYTSFSQWCNWGSGGVSAIRLLGIDTVTSTATLDNIYGADGIYYYFPAIYTDPSDRLFMVFSRSSEEEYIGIHYVEDLLNDPASKLLRQGDNHHSGSSPTRWGDYGSIAPDPDDQNFVWLFHEYADNIQNIWNTWIGQIPSSIGKPSPALPLDDSQVELPVTLAWDTTAAATSYLFQLDDDENFSSPVLDTTVDINEIEFTNLTDITEYFWRAQGISLCPGNEWSDTWSFTVCNFLAGDADSNLIVEISDIVYIVAYIFESGPAPMPVQSGDVDCNTLVEISDAVWLVDYVFNAGPPPCKQC